MNATKADTPRSDTVKPYLMLLPALVLALSLAFTGAAFAQTPFQASVTFTGTLPSGGCANGAYSCGTADIAGYGAASWNWYPVPTIVQTSCGSTYTATTYFTLLSDPNSTLALSESGNLCGPGLDANGYFKGRFPKDYGRPFSALGTWTTATAVNTDCSTIVVPGEPPCSTGQFAGLGGTGTDILQIAGAHTAGSYSGTLG